MYQPTFPPSYPNTSSSFYRCPICNRPATSCKCNEEGINAFLEIGKAIGGFFVVEYTNLLRC